MNELKSMTIDEMRAIISDVTRSAHKGDISASHANAVSNATGKFLQSLKLEMEYLRLSGRKIDIPLLDREEGK